MLSARAEFVTRSASRALGIVLLAAGLLKASAKFAALYHFGRIAPAESWADAAMLALAIVEVAVGITLTQRPFSVAVWRFACVLFAAFCLAAIAQASIGRQVCDCFGAVVFKPIYTAVFDAIAACICGGVIGSLRRYSPASPPNLAGHSLVATIVVFALTFGGLLILRESWLGSSRYGVPPVVAELQIDDSDPIDGWLSGCALLASRGAQSVRVLGCVQHCGLQVGRALPFVIGPNHVARLPLRVRRPRRAQVGLVPLTLLVEVGGSLEKLTLPLLTPWLTR